MADNDYQLADFRDGLAASLAEALADYQRIADLVEGGEQPDDLPEAQAEALDAAVTLTRLSRAAAELSAGEPADEVVADLEALSPLVQALAESYVLFGLARSWQELLEEPLVTPAFVSQHMTDRVRELVAIST